MIEIGLDSVCYFILLAREFDVKVGPEEVDLETPADDDAEAAVFEAHAHDPTLQQLRELVNGLAVDEQIELVALCWVGRGDFEAATWAEAKQAARDAHTSHTADYLLGIPQVGDFVEEGLSQLGYSCADVERRHL